MLDGWFKNGVHYLAVFEISSGVPYNGILLGFSPFEDEKGLLAEAHEKYLKDILSDFFKRSIEDVLHMIGDDFGVNRKIFKKSRI